MADRPLAHVFWYALDAVDYWLMQARLGIVDAVCGPEPETAADRHRERSGAQLTQILVGRGGASCVQVIRSPLITQSKVK